MFSNVCLISEDSDLPAPYNWKDLLAPLVPESPPTGFFPSAFSFEALQFPAVMLEISGCWCHKAAVSICSRSGKKSWQSMIIAQGESSVKMVLALASVVCSAYHRCSLNVWKMTQERKRRIRKERLDDVQKLGVDVRRFYSRAVSPVMINQLFSTNLLSSFCMLDTS